jgi:hypothetical protein
MMCNVVVACTKSKRGLASEVCRIAEYPKSPLDTLLREWKDGVAEERGRTSAFSLYKGNAWHQVVQCLNMPDVQWHVASAGFGLISHGTLLPAYEASFSAGPDQIAARIEGPMPASTKHRHWWNAVRRAMSHLNTPLEELECGHLIVVCGREYLAAMNDDLLHLSATLGPGRLLVVSAGAHRLHPQIENCRLPVRGGARQVLRVPQVALNNRILRWLLSEVLEPGSWDFEAARDKARRSFPASESTCQERRGRLEDGEVLSWLTERIRCSDRTSRSTLLKELRATGHACEQSRFSRLYEEAVRVLSETR